LKSFVSTTFLAWGYFEILFTDEEGAKATRKITTIEWSGLNLSFSIYIPNFDACIQGTMALLSHSIKVQFLNLHEQVKNTKALTIMASKIGEVLEIKATYSDMKRPVGPMITKVRDISKLADYIRIPSMAEGASVKDTTAQRILYSDLPNQCWKCCIFDHFAQPYTITKTII
jgi:hypothetical protein